MPNELVRVEIRRNGQCTSPSIMLHPQDGSDTPSTYQSTLVSFPASSPSMSSSSNLASLMSEEANLVTAYGYPTGPLSSKSEAIEYFKSRSLKDYQRVVCPRDGCNRTVPNLRAFAAHLESHKIDDRSFKCPSCSHRYETKKEIAMHMCGGRSHHRTRHSAVKAGLSNLTKRFAFSKGN